MKYYLHDSNSFNDEKVTLLYMKYGYEGVGLFYVILEKLAQQEKPVPEIVLKSQLNIKKKLEKVLNFMYEIGVLSIKNGEVFSETLLNFSEKYKIKKEKTRIKVAEWRNNQKDKKNVTDYVPVSNPPKVKLSKVKLSKEIKRGYIKEDFLEIFNRWLQYKKDKKQTYKNEDSIEMAYKKLYKFADGNPKIATEIIEQSLANNWAGLFQLKENPKKSGFDRHVEHSNDFSEQYPSSKK